MSFTKKGFVDIYQSMENETRQQGQLSHFAEGSVIRSLYESFAIELASLYEQMDLVYQSAFIDTATGSHLDRVVAILGVKRNEPDFATGEITFERESDLNEKLLIPLGTLVTTEDSKNEDDGELIRKSYQTIEEATFEADNESQLTVKIQAMQCGGMMETGENTIVIMPRPLTGIKTVSNEKPIRFVGRERETDEQLRQRAKNSLMVAGRGSIKSLENALLNIAGVREVRIEEKFKTRGNDKEKGVIHIYIDGLNTLNSQLIESTIDNVRAAGVFTIISATESIGLAISANITLNKNIPNDEKAALTQTIENNIKVFISSLQMGESLLFSQLNRIIMNTKGVEDLSDLAIETQLNDQKTHYTVTEKVIECALNQRFAFITLNKHEATAS